MQKKRAYKVVNVARFYPSIAGRSLRRLDMQIGTGGNAESNVVNAGDGCLFTKGLLLYSLARRQCRAIASPAALRAGAGQAALWHHARLVWQPVLVL